MRTDCVEFSEMLASDLTVAARGLFEVRCLFHFGFDQKDNIKAVLDLIFGFGTGENIRLVSETDQLYLDSIRFLLSRSVIEGGSILVRQRNRIQEIDESYDFFYNVRDEQDWSLLRFISFWLRAKIRPLREVAIVTSIRNEGINLLEWVAHHRVLGVEDFIMYVNDNDDGSSGLLNLLAKHELIHVVWNQTAVGKSGDTNMFPIQAKAFGHASEFLLEARNFKWLLFLDLDEFLLTRPVFESPSFGRPLDDLFAKLEALPRQPSAVSFNWKWFKSRCQFARTPGLNFERFHDWVGSDHVKTMARSDRCISFQTSHIPRFPPQDLVLDGKLEPVERPWFAMPVTYGYGQINHYFNKSFEEFIGKHLRVWGDRTLSNFFDMGNNRQGGSIEKLPDGWIARVRSEVAALNALSGVSDELEEVELVYGEILAQFDRKFNIRRLYDKFFAEAG